MKQSRQIIVICLFVAVVLLPLLSQLLQSEEDLESNKNFHYKDETKQKNIYDNPDNLSPPKLADERNIRGRHLPQVIGIGVKKCSSTAMFFYLCSHPKTKCSPGELRFFNHDDEYIQGLEYYKTRFPARTADEIGYEKTPQYLTMKTVPRRIKDTYRKANQSVKFILSICDPTLRAYSDHKHMLAIPNQKMKENESDLYSFDEYVKKRLPEFKRFIQNDGLAKLENYNDSSYKTFHGQYKHFLTGIYSYHLRRWFELFPKEDILIVDGDLLISKPWLVMEKVQSFLQISQFLKKENFVRSRETGFYCLNTRHRLRCMGENKGRTRILTNDAQVTSRISESSKTILQNFYHPYNIDLLNLTKQTFEWAT